MTTYYNELTIDLGAVGYWNHKEPFRVRLHASNLQKLIKDAFNVHRVYELLLIDRPGDVWDYVSVSADQVPEIVSRQINDARQKSKHPWEEHYPWSETCIPFAIFDKFFISMGDDTLPPDEAWRKQRNSSVMVGYARQLLAIVRTAQNSLPWNDHLIRHITDKVKSGNHPFACLSRADAIERSSGKKPNEPTHTAEFYKKLNQLLRDPDLTSIAYRASGDYKVLRMLATEQRRRANLTHHDPDDALQINAIVNNPLTNDTWDSNIIFYGAGLGYGDLLIEGGGLGSARIKQLLEKHGHKPPGRFILSIKDEGDIQGFDKESGDGWFLYKRQSPLNRRCCLDHKESHRFRKPGPVLKFAAQSATLFDHEKTLIIVGAEVNAAIKNALACVIAEWETFGGDPIVIVMGDHRPFEDACCKRIYTPPGEDQNTLVKSEWLSTLLRMERPWIDVILALEAPNWICRELSSHIQRAEVPWSPWVVRSTGSAGLEASLILEGDLESVISDAHRHAKTSRH